MQMYALFFCCSLVSATRCSLEKKLLKFYKIKSCYKSTLPVVSSKNVNSAEDCTKHAREKSGLAFNFSPLMGTKVNCQVLGCPELLNSTTLIFDPGYDYYTAYADFNLNSTCIRSVGLFELIHRKLNYTDAVNYCYSIGADLADAMSEFRTNHLSGFLGSLKAWYKAAYIGLDDMEQEGIFQTSAGNLLECTKYRAWAVGHPRPNHTKEDCVILDVDKTWRAINCKIKLPFICEFFSLPPDAALMDFAYQNCTQLSPRSKRKCLQDNEMFELYNQSSRVDQCALVNSLL